jgi:transcriptional regulator with PAS, ATPase and Fis domain
MEKTAPASTTTLTPDLGLIGTSAYMEEMRQEIARIAEGDFPVMIQGDSGTGKDIVAHAIHGRSKRSAKRMVIINCAAIPKHLEEAEFFGYAKGAFTGANAVKQGIIETADNSTLFLDEVGEVSLEIQAKLLRVLDSGEFIPVGSTTVRKVDIRIISATNRDLSDMMKQESFRQDLFFRLKGAVITTIPLVRHKEDIPALINHFLSKEEDPNIPRHISPVALDLLMDYSWPGNIRELRYTVEVICMASIGMKSIHEQTVRSVLKMNVAEPEQPLTYKEGKAGTIRDFEIRYFTKLLNQFKGNINQASKIAGMYRPNLLKKLKQLGIAPNSFRPPKKTV